MKRIILFLSLPFFLFAFSFNGELCFRFLHGSWGYQCFRPLSPAYPSYHDDIKAGADLFVNGYIYKFSKSYVISDFNSSDVDSDCAKYYYKNINNNKLVFLINGVDSIPGSFALPYSLYLFCRKSFHPGHVFDSTQGAWISPGKPPICPFDKEYSYVRNKCEDKKNCSDGEVFNYTKEKCVSVCPDSQIYDPATKKCIEPPKCPDQQTLLKQVAPSCSGAENVKNLKCDKKTGKITYQCLQCKDIVKKYFNKCKSQGQILDFRCNSNSTSLNFNYKCKDLNNSASNTFNINLNNTSIVCEGGQDIVINEDGNISCVNRGHSSVDPNDNNYSNFSNNNSNNSNYNSNSSNNPPPSHSNLDCCNLYKKQQIGDQWLQVSANVWKQLNSPNCIVTVSNGVCAVSTSSSSSNSNNAQLSDISSKISNTNSKLDKINQNLNDIINMKPDKNYDSNVSSGFISLFSGFSENIDNTKKSLNNLKNSFNQITNLLSQHKKISFFKTEINTCPVNFYIFHQKLTADICSFVSPYKPIIQLFFTIIFSFSVIFYFFDVFIRGGYK